MEPERRRGPVKRPRPRRAAWAAALVCGSVASGCACEYSRQHAFEDGWRFAKVAKIGSDFTAPLRPTDDCRRATPEVGGGIPRFAELWFIDHRHLRRRIVALPADRALSVGDKVYVNLQDCRVPLAPGRADAGAVDP